MMFAALLAAAATAPWAAALAVPKDQASACAAGELVLKKGGTQALRPRGPEGPARIFDFIQFCSAHELPELRLRLAEMGPLVDEFHVVEADRTWVGHPKKFVLPELLEKDPELAKWKDKVTVHRLKLPAHKKGWDVQKAMINMWRDIPKGRYGVLIEADLDEILSRPVLKALRFCVPEKIGYWDAHVDMNTYKYSMAWTSGKWVWPPIVRETRHGHSLSQLGARRSAQSHSLATQRLPRALARVATRVETVAGIHDSDDAAAATAVASVADMAEGSASGASAGAEFVVGRPNGIRLKDGQAGWHLSWVLDGPPGIAYKFLHCWHPLSSLPYYVTSHARSEKDLAKWLEKDFMKRASFYDHDVRKAAKANATDLPESLREAPQKYPEILGDVKLSE
jgi:hypothetical protein